MSKYIFRFGETKIHELKDITMKNNILILPEDIIDNLTDNNKEIYLLPSENKNMIELCSEEVVGFVEKEINKFSCGSNNGRKIRRYYLSRMVCVEMYDGCSIELPYAYVKLLSDFAEDIIGDVELHLGYREIPEINKYIYNLTAY